MYYLFANVMPVLSSSLDSTLKWADFLFNVLVPGFLIIAVLGALFRKKD